MSINLRLVALVVLIASVCGGIYFYLRPGIPPADVTRAISYSITVSNRSNRAIPEASIKIFHPLSSGATQRLLEIKASSTFERITKTPESLNINFLLPPYGTKVIDINAKLSLWSAPHWNNDSPEVYLAPDEFAESTNSEVTKLALTLIAGSKYETARNILTWINQSITPEMFNSEMLPASAILKSKKGDCTEFANLFVALARASKIPARTVAGFIVDRDKRLKASEYHNWAEFYDSGLWKIADPIQGTFDSQYTNYVTFRHLTGSDKKSYADSTQRFSTNSSEIEVRIN